MQAPQQRRSRATVDALVATTVGELRRPHQEADLEVQSLARRAGCSVGAVYHHFGDREGLLDAARLALFIAESDADRERIRAVCTASKTFDDLRLGIGTLARLGHAPEHRRLRLQRLGVLADTAHRPELAARVAIEQHRLTNDLAAVFATLSARNIIAADADPRRVALFVQAQMLGQVVGDLDVEPVAAEVWSSVFDAALVALLAPVGTPRTPAPPPAPAERPPAGARGGATARALLAAARRQLELNGEVGFRVDEVLAETGASPSSLYHHYDGRDGLIEAAWIDLARSQSLDDGAALQTAFAAADDPAEALRRVQQLVRSAQQPEWAARRAQRLQLFASALARPSLQRAVAEVETDTTRLYIAAISAAQARGLVRADGNPAMIAKFVRALVFGQVAHELSRQADDLEAWGAMVDDHLAQLLLPADG